MKSIFRHYWHSSSFKVAVFFTTLLGLSSILLIYFLYNLNKNALFAETQATLDIEFEHIQWVLLKNLEKTLLEYLYQKIDTKNHFIYFYENSSQRPIVDDIPTFPDHLKNLKMNQIHFIEPFGNIEYKLVIKIYALQNGSRVLIGRNISPLLEIYEQFKLFCIFIMILMSIVVIVSFLISSFVVERINIIANTAKEIMETGDLSKRVLIKGNWDDLSNLAQVLNLFLSQIESLMQGIQEVTDNIAHDLRTPLTRLRNQLEELKNKRLTQKELDFLLKEANHLLSIFNSLLRISRLEKGNFKSNFEPCNIQIILQHVISFYEPLAEKKKIIFTTKYISEILYISGDPDLLFQLFVNVIDNAIKFTPSKKEVLIQVKKQQQKILIQIADSGIGIDTSELEKVFDRFYRSDKSRHIKGNGLGLSMVKAITELHQGTIQLKNNHPGLIVVIEFSLISSQK